MIFNVHYYLAFYSHRFNNCIAVGSLCCIHQACYCYRCEHEELSNDSFADNDPEITLPIDPLAEKASLVSIADNVADASTLALIAARLLLR